MRHGDDDKGGLADKHALPSARPLVSINYLIN